MLTGTRSISTSAHKFFPLLYLTVLVKLILLLQQNCDSNTSLPCHECSQMCCMVESQRIWWREMHLEWWGWRCIVLDLPWVHPVDHDNIVVPRRSSLDVIVIRCEFNPIIPCTGRLGSILLLRSFIHLRCLNTWLTVDELDKLWMDNSVGLNLTESTRLGLIIQVISSVHGNSSLHSWARVPIICSVPNSLNDTMK